MQIQDQTEDLLYSLIFFLGFFFEFSLLSLYAINFISADAFFVFSIVVATMTGMLIAVVDSIWYHQKSR